MCKNHAWKKLVFPDVLGRLTSGEVCSSFYNKEKKKNGKSLFLHLHLQTFFIYSTPVLSCFELYFRIFCNFF